MFAVCLVKFKRDLKIKELKEKHFYVMKICVLNFAFHLEIKVWSLEKDWRHRIQAA